MIGSTEKCSGAGKRFFSGVVILSAATLIVKAIGVFFKIPMIALIGLEGMGYFNAAYHFFSLLMTISTAGLPVALSILVSKDTVEGNISNVRRDFRVSLVIFGLCGAAFSLMLFLASDSIANAMQIDKTALCLKAVAPAVLCITVSGAIRGYFQGFEIMYPTAVSEVIEAVGKLCFGLSFALYAINKGYEPYVVAAYAIAGLTLGVIVSMVYLVISKTFFERRISRSYAKLPPTEGIRAVAASLCRTALRVTISSAVLSLTTLFDTMIIPSALIKSGLSSDASFNLYSTYTNLAVPMFGFPTAFMVPLSLALVPAVVAAAKRNDSESEQRVMNSSFRLCGIMALPCTFGLAVMAEPILTMMFSSQTDAIPIAAPLLSVLASSIFFSGLMTVSNSMLQAYGHQMMPIASLVVGALVKVVSEWILVSVPEINIYGAPVSTFLCTTAIMMMNFGFLAKITGNKVAPVRIFLPTLLCSALSAVIPIISYYLLYPIMHQAIATILSIIITAVFYALFIIKSGALPSSELLLFPFGEKLCGVLRRLRLIK
jgi:stage V sporulation protein B